MQILFILYNLIKLVKELLYNIGFLNLFNNKIILIYYFKIIKKEIKLAYIERFKIKITPKIKILIEVIININIIHLN